VPAKCRPKKAVHHGNAEAAPAPRCHSRLEFSYLFSFHTRSMLASEIGYVMNCSLHVDTSAESLISSRSCRLNRQVTSVHSTCLQSTVKTSIAFVTSMFQDFVNVAANTLAISLGSAVHPLIFEREPGSSCSSQRVFDFVIRPRPSFACREDCLTIPLASWRSDKISFMRRVHYVFDAPCTGARRDDACFVHRQHRFGRSLTVAPILAPSMSSFHQYYV
jgi:hypothetical protein